MDWDLVTIFGFVLVLVAMVRLMPRRPRAGDVDPAVLGEARQVAGRLEGRIEALERILDEDLPGWRSRSRA